MGTSELKLSVALYILTLLGSTSSMSLIAMLKYLESPAAEPMIEKCGPYGSAPDIENELIPFEEVPPFKDGFEAFPEWIKNIAIPAIEDWVAKDAEDLESRTCDACCKCFNENGNAEITKRNRRVGGIWGSWKTCSECKCDFEPSYTDMKKCFGNK